ncbi:alpha/beta hydrolase [Teichococcus aestuarii]|uniref:alpha/beta hydrolase n=1 Tax=Teichococcus aestuarii TaxID=568898 RepID=UPI00360C0FA7
MQRRALLAAPLLAPPLLGLAAAPAAAQPAGVAMDEMLIPGGDPGIQLYLRNKRPEAATPARPDRTILCVHGATYPASTTFDLAVGGVSWMDYMAGRGFDVWCLDLRNYGRSTREAAMGQPPEANPPLTRGAVAQKDIAAAAAHIRELRGLPKIMHLGWSWGSSLQARFAADNPALVERLVLYAPQWLREGPSPPPRPVRRGGAARRLPQRNARSGPRPLDERRAGGAARPPLPRRLVRALGRFDLRDRPGGDAAGALRAARAQWRAAGSREFWQAGKPYYDPAAITAPTLVVLAEWDQDTPPSMAMALFPLLTASPGKRLVLLGGGTHGIMLERQRGALFQAVQVFLEEAIGG